LKPVGVDPDRQRPYLKVVENSPAPTPSSAPDAEKLERAKRRVAAIKGFYIHLAVFVLVIAGLAVVNLVTGKPWWVLWVVLGWGIGVLGHAVGVYGRTPKVVENWERRKLEQLMDDR
jgi:2TM domain